MSLDSHADIRCTSDNVSRGDINAIRIDEFNVRECRRYREFHISRFNNNTPGSAVGVTRKRKRSPFTDSGRINDGKGADIDGARFDST